MIKFNVHEAKTKLSSLLLKVEQGKTVCICRNGVAVAELRPISKKIRKLKIPISLKIKIFADPTEPLSAEDWGEFGAP